MKKTVKVLSVAAVVLVLLASLRPAMSYFTTYTQARGGYRIQLGHDEEISERVVDRVKYLTVTNDPDSVPVYIRARAFSGEAITLSTVSPDGTWTQDGDWWYFNAVVAPGASTTELNVQILNVPEDAEEGDTFNVVIVYESTAARYDENGEAYADWTTILDVRTTGGDE